MDFLGFIIICVKVLLVFTATMLGVLGMVYAERRVSAFIQDRVGPNRVGPKGLLQPIADGIKFLMKEDIIPDRADKPIFIFSSGYSSHSCPHDVCRDSIWISDYPIWAGDCPSGG